ncbi:unnamed protein product [Ilex paraguariensis]|uniref:Uncharacterized protein n=1 Tax=Ilex paraguariensis TaxID=185542 RepID=A0ABC8TFH4_9AQUA
MGVEDLMLLAYRHSHKFGEWFCFDGFYVGGGKCQVVSSQPCTSSILQFQMLGTFLVLSTLILFAFAKKRTTKKEGIKQIEAAYNVGSVGLQSNSESKNDWITSEDHEVNGTSWKTVDQSGITSNGSISDDDDENLIEIAFPNQTVTLTEELKQQGNRNVPTWLPESIFEQRGLMDLLPDLNEVNEEETLIEIDISNGSIKC